MVPRVGFPPFRYLTTLVDRPLLVVGVVQGRVPLDGVCEQGQHRGLGVEARPAIRQQEQQLLPVIRSQTVPCPLLQGAALQESHSFLNVAAAVGNKCHHRHQF